MARYTHDSDVIDVELSDGRSFVLGDEISISDFSFGGYLMHAAEVEVPIHVGAWLDRLRTQNGRQYPYEMLAS